MPMIFCVLAKWFLDHFVLFKVANFKKLRDNVCFAVLHITGLN